MEASANHQLPLVGSHSRNDLIDQRWFPSPNHVVMNVATSAVNNSPEKNLPDGLKLVKALYDSWKYMTTNVKYEDVAICLGNTRSGKSTLINTLIGNRLSIKRNGIRGSMAISLADDQSSGPQIGITSTVPSRWTSNIFPSLIMWDTPGFDELRDTFRDVINASHNFHLIQRVKKIKIIVVVDINDILNDSVKPFLFVLNELENLLGDQMKFMFSSVSIVFSKVPNFINDIPVDVEFITEILKEQFLASEDLPLTTLTKEFLLYLTENVDRIALFKRMEPGENIVAANNIRQVINNSTSLNNGALKKLKISIPNSSKIFLFNAHSVLTSKAEFIALGNILRSVYQSKIDVLKDVENKMSNECELQTYLNELKLIGKQISIVIQENNLTLKIKLLKSIDVSIGNKIEEHRLIERAPLIEFSDKILEMNECGELALHLQSILFAISLNLTEVSLYHVGASANKGYEDLTNKEHDEFPNRFLQLQKELQTLVKQNNERKIFFENLDIKKLVLSCELKRDKLIKKQKEVEQFSKRVIARNEDCRYLLEKDNLNDEVVQPSSAASPPKPNFKCIITISLIFCVGFLIYRLST